MRCLLLLLLACGYHALAQTKPPLRVTHLHRNVYAHTTYGIYQHMAIPAHGLIINTRDGVVLVDTGWDTPANTDNTRQLLDWVARHLRRPVRLCIVTHAHDDRIGGISELRKAGIRVVSTALTAHYAVKEGYEAPEAALPNDTTFRVGREILRCYFPGEGHSHDNLVVWLPRHRILHGGCFVKSVSAFGLGNLSDANTTEWSHSMRRVIREFGAARLVIPGHDDWGDARSLTHTLTLLEKHGKEKR